MFVIYLNTSSTCKPSGSMCGAEAVEEKAADNNLHLHLHHMMEHHPALSSPRSLPPTPPALRSIRVDRTRSSGNWVDLSRETLRRL